MTGSSPSRGREQHLVEVGQLQLAALELPLALRAERRRARRARSPSGDVEARARRRRSRCATARRGRAATSSLVRPDFTDCGWSSGSQPGTACVVVLVEEEPLLLARPAAVACGRARSARPASRRARSKWSSPSLDRLRRVVVPRRGLQVPQSHTITSPPPYSPLGITPSKSK